MGSVAPAPQPTPDPSLGAEAENSPLAAPATEKRAEDSAFQAPIETLQAAVLQALMDANQRILVSMLSAGDWSVVGNELIIKVPESETVVSMSLGSEGKRLAMASASGVLGRAVKLKVIPGVSMTPEDKKNGAQPCTAGAGGRGRAEQDPIVRRMQEKFGAEIRTVIDYREKR